jgi:hypothetical protein
MQSKNTPTIVLILPTESRKMVCISKNSPVAGKQDFHTLGTESFYLYVRASTMGVIGTGLFYGAIIISKVCVCWCKLQVCVGWCNNNRFSSKERRSLCKNVFRNIFVLLG